MPWPKKLETASQEKSNIISCGLGERETAVGLLNDLLTFQNLKLENAPESPGSGPERHCSGRAQ